MIARHAQNVNGIAFTPDGRALVSAGYDATLRIAALNGQGSPTTVTMPTPLNTVAVAPDGEIITAGADGKVYLVSAAGALIGEADAGQAPSCRCELHRRQADRRRRRRLVPIIERAARKLNAPWLGRGCRSGGSFFSRTGERFSPARPIG